MMRNVTIVIPSKKIEFLQRAVRSVIATHTRLESYDFVVVDDGLAERPALCERLTYLDGKKPFSFAGNVNVALRAINPEHDVILMNDDIECRTPDGMEKLRWAAYQRSRVGLVTPLFVQRGWQAIPPGDDEASREMWTESEHFLIFAVGYFRRGAIDEIGLLDESLDGYGFDDIDYCIRAHLAGFELVLMPNVVMAHGDDKGPTVSFRELPDYKEIHNRNQERFLKKWGTSLIGLTPEQVERFLWFVRFSFLWSSLPGIARARLARATRPREDRVVTTAR